MSLACKILGHKTIEIKRISYKCSWIPDDILFECSRCKDKHLTWFTYGSIKAWFTRYGWRTHTSKDPK